MSNIQPKNPHNPSMPAEAPLRPTQPPRETMRNHTEPHKITNRNLLNLKKHKILIFTKSLREESRKKNTTGFRFASNV